MDDFEDTLEQIEALWDKKRRFLDEIFRWDHSRDFDFGRQDPADEFTFGIFVDLYGVLEDAYKEAFPKRRKVTTDRVFEDIPEKANDILEAYGEKVQQMRAEIENAIGELEDKARELADSIEIEETDEETVIDTASNSTYRSQGFGASKYAKASLRGTLMKVRGLGIGAEIRDISDRDDYPLGDWAVVAEVDSIGAEVIERKPDPSKDEIIEQMRRHNVNPKVYFPYE